MLRFSFLFLRSAKGIPKGHSLAAFKPGIASGTGGIAEHIDQVTQSVKLLIDDNGNDIDELDDEVAMISKRSPSNLPKQAKQAADLVDTEDI